MTHDEFRESFFEAYGESSDSFNDAWFEAFFHKVYDEGDPVEFEIEWESHAEGVSVPAGVESEKLLIFDDGDGICYWTLSSLSGSQGPFESRTEAIDALGYDPDEFPPDSSDEDEELEVEDDEEEEADRTPDFDDDDDDIDDSEAYEEEEED